MYSIVRRVLIRVLNSLGWHVRSRRVWDLTVGAWDALQYIERSGYLTQVWRDQYWLASSAVIRQRALAQCLAQLRGIALASWRVPFTDVFLWRVGDVWEWSRQVHNAFQWIETLPRRQRRKIAWYFTRGEVIASGTH